jgi:hypothetical protein
MRKSYSLFFVFCLIAVLSGCSGAKKMLGLARTAPDEFTVLTRAPLSLPPNYELTPPKPGARRVQDGDSNKVAKKTLFAEDEPDIYSSNYSSQNLKEEENKSLGETALLEKAGAKKAKSNIKKILDSENSELVDGSKEFTDKIIFWQNKGDESEVLVDAAKEAKRLQENKALGKSVNSGDVPVIEKKDKGFLEGIF